MSFMKPVHKNQKIHPQKMRPTYETSGIKFLVSIEQVLGAGVIISKLKLLVPNMTKKSCFSSSISSLFSLLNRAIFL